MPSSSNFSCGRTCRPFTPCRFAAILAAAGVRHEVVSHTTRVRVNLRPGPALEAAVRAVGGQVLGEGSHRLYSSTEQGFAFTLPGWRYPIVVDAAGNCRYDDYQGACGDARDIARLTGRYAIEAARAAAAAQGWISEIQPDGTLLIYHPGGGTMTVRPDGTLDAAGFVGAGCDDAAAIENALGTVVERANKCEYFAEHAKIRQGGD